MPTATEVKTQGDIQNLPMRRFNDGSGNAVNAPRISWGAIFAGSAVGLVVQVWLTFLGVAIGASAINPMESTPSATTMGASSAIWLAISILISSYVGGWVAGRASGVARRGLAAMHGATSWAVSTMVAFMLVGTAFGAVISGVSGMAKGALSIAGNGAAATANQNPGAIGQAVDAARQGAANALDQAQNAIQSGQAAQAGETAAKAVARSSWGAVVLLLLGLLAGVRGAAMAAPRTPTPQKL
jgi:hypothetical protein